MIEETEISQNFYLSSKPEAIRKWLGQYFTGSKIATYMASMIQPENTPVIRILDAGAGTGILTIAAAKHCLDLGHKRIHAVLYEIDKDAIIPLHSNMSNLTSLFKGQKGDFTFEIRNQDFVLERPDKTEKPFHIASMNPPYFKYNSKTSPYAGATIDLYKGNPNIYASFMAIVAGCLAPNGQMVAIIPRSFTNGLYFRGFRQYLNKVLSLEKIHVFRARDKIFKEMSVLQENIISYYVKREQLSKIQVYTSTSDKDLENSEFKEYPSNLIIDLSSNHNFIRIPESSEDAKILKIVEEWPTNFEKSNYFISTGPVVEHRTKKYITSIQSNSKSIPLLKMHNVKPFKVEWTGCKKKDARFLLIDDFKKHTSHNTTYIILKRFSSKEEKRRLVAGVHTPKIVKGSLIALENHLNYIGKKDKELDFSEAYGLAALFNSTFMDKYFRTISGSTQVNATEIRLLKLPSLKIILQIGNEFIKKNLIDQQNIDDIVTRYLKI